MRIKRRMAERWIAPAPEAIRLGDDIAKIPRRHDADPSTGLRFRL